MDSSRVDVNLVSEQYRKTNLGVWVYSGLGLSSMFKKFETVQDAVIEAIKHEGAYVLHNGKEIAYGKIEDNVIYYKTPEDKIVFVEVND